MNRKQRLIASHLKLARDRATVFTNKHLRGKAKLHRTASDARPATVKQDRSVAQSGATMRVNKQAAPRSAVSSIAQMVPLHVLDQWSLTRTAQDKQEWNPRDSLNSRFLG